MVYVVIAIAAVAIVVYCFFFHQKKLLLRSMNTGVDQVKLGLYSILRSKFATEHGEDTAGSLAAAVTNEIFSELPSTPEAEEFLQSHRDIVERELSTLKHDDRIRAVVTQAVRVKTTISYAKGVRGRESLLDPIDKLLQLGILLPGGDPPSPWSFLRSAEEFYLSSVQQASGRDSTP